MKTFLESLEQADIENIEKMIAAGVDINKPLTNGELPLEMVINLILEFNNNKFFTPKHVEVVNILLNSGAQPTIKNKKQQSLLHQLCNINDNILRMFLFLRKNASSSFESAKKIAIAIIPSLIKVGADINEKAEKNYTPLMLALLNGHIEIAKYLLDAGALVDETVSSDNQKNILHCAAVGGNKCPTEMNELVERLLIQYSLQNQINGFECNHCTPLDLTSDNHMRYTLIKHGGISSRHDHIDYFFNAVYSKHEDLVSYLLSNGVAKLVKENGSTALHKAQSLKAIQLLLEHGASVTAVRKPDGCTPLSAWIKGVGIHNNINDALEIVKLFLLHESNLQHADNKLQTVLHHAVLNNNLPIIKYLIEKEKTLISAQDDNGDTPLHLSLATFSSHANVEIITLLIAASTQCNLKNKSLLNALECLKFSTYDFRFDNEKLSALRKAIYPLIQICSPNELPSNSTSLWWLAMQTNDLPLAEMLYARGIDLHIEFEERPVWHFAIENNSFLIMEWLKNKNLNFNQQARNNGDTALHVAVRALKTDMVEMLLQAGISLNAVNLAKNNALHILFNGITTSGFWGNNQPIEECLKNGAKIFDLISIEEALMEQKNKREETPFEICIECNRTIPSLWIFTRYFIIKTPSILNKYFSASFYIFDSFINPIISQVISYKDKEVMKILLEYHAENLLFPLLLEIINRADSELMDVLLKYGLNLNEPFMLHNELLLPLEYVFSKVQHHHESVTNKQYEDFICHLITKGADIHFASNVPNGLKVAISRGWFNLMKLLLEKNNGFSANSLFKVEYGDELTSPLLYAVKTNSPTIAQLLIEHGANIHYMQCNTQTALHIACAQGNLELIKYLVAAGANIEAKANLDNIFSVYKVSPLYFAMANNPEANNIISFLLDKNAKVDDMSLLKALITPLSLNNIIRICEQLFPEDLIRIRALHVAVSYNQEDIVKYLLSLPIADQLLHALNNRGETPLHLAVLPQRENIFCQLIEHGSDINVLDYAGHSAVVYAICHNTAIEYGINLPVNLNTKNFQNLKLRLINEQEFSQFYREQERDFQLSLYCYKLCMAFTTMDTALAYIERYRDKNSKQVLHDLCLFNLPTSGTWDNHCWEKLVLQETKEVLNYLHLAPRIEEKLGRAPLNLDEIKNIAASIKYNREAENSQLAELFMRYQVPEHAFNRVLDAYVPKLEDDMPPLYIEGQEFNEPRYYFKRLQPNDWRGFIAGNFTHCCQSVGSAGEACAMHAMTSKYGAIYAVFKRDMAEIKKYTELNLLAKKATTFDEFIQSVSYKSQRKKYTEFANNIAANDKLDFVRGHFEAELKLHEEGELIAQCWAWLSKANNLVFDSWERLRAEDDRLCESFMKCSAEQAIKKFNINKVLIGAGGQTPDNLSFEIAEQLEMPKDYYDYRDSNNKQYLIAEKRRLEKIIVNEKEEQKNIGTDEQALSYSISQNISNFSPLFNTPQQQATEIKYTIEQMGFLLKHYLINPKITIFPAITDIKAVTTNDNYISKIKLLYDNSNNFASCIIPIKYAKENWACLICELYPAVQKQLKNYIDHNTQPELHIVYLDPSNLVVYHDPSNLMSPYSLETFLSKCFSAPIYPSFIKRLHTTYTNRSQDTAPWIINALKIYASNCQLKLSTEWDMEKIKAEHATIVQAHFIDQEEQQSLAINLND